MAITRKYTINSNRIQKHLIQKTPDHSTWQFKNSRPINPTLKNSFANFYAGWRRINPKAVDSLIHYNLQPRSLSYSVTPSHSSKNDKFVGMWTHTKSINSIRDRKVYKQSITQLTLHESYWLTDLMPSRLRAYVTNAWNVMWNFVLISVTITDNITHEHKNKHKTSNITFKKGNFSWSFAMYQQCSDRNKCSLIFIS